MSHLRGTECPQCGLLNRNNHNKTTEEFIERAKAVHGDKYDYSKVNYVKNNIKVEIICKKHGSFFQMPLSHLKGCECLECSKEKLGFGKRTTEQFIEEAKAVHGSLYDYSKANYVKTKTPVEIICREHGSFFQKPYMHLNGSGCPKCSAKNKTNNNFVKLTTEEFIERAKAVHGDKYDYSKVVYKDAHSLVDIICKKHGLFTQMANTHLSGSGCKKCSLEDTKNRARKTTEQFIEEAKAVHGDKYDYSKVNYINNRTKVEIICREHGSFLQIPDRHLHGCGCKECSKEMLSKAITLTTEQFIEQAKKVHGDKYDYSLVDYKSANEKVEIVCREHGSFFQTPHSHLCGCGCRECGKEKIRIGLDEFIKRAQAVHGTKYDYSLVKYHDCDSKVEIICPVHGSFFQTPYSHTQGIGCPKCNSSHGETMIRMWLDYNNMDYEEQKKFEGCRDKGLLSYDFYIPSENTAIEFK